MSRISYVTSESVSEGHPDKLSDQISDAILDELLRQDPNSRVAVETLVKNSMVICAGEVRTKGYADVQTIAREVLEDIGYTDPSYGIDYEDAAVLSAISAQSPDIAMGVDESDGHEQGAGDQGMMYGYACTETPELMPLPIMKAHEIVKLLAKLRKDDSIGGLGPDAKSQVSVRYVDGKPDAITAVVVSQQHDADRDVDDLREEIRRQVIEPVCGDFLADDAKIHINATGRFVIGGPESDAGLTGRKIVVDTYGGVGRVGGGAFSGKDPSKVDRSAAYMARYVAKNLVAAGVADRIEVQLSYSIGVAQPTSVDVNSFGTATVDEEKISEIVSEVFDMRPRAIVEQLDLLRPIYRETARHGHFGREDLGVPWEKTDKVDDIKALLAAPKKVAGKIANAQ